MKSQSIRVADIELVDDSFFYIKFRENIELALHDAEELLASLTDLKKKSCHRIYHYNKNISFTLDAISTLASKSTATAVAVLYDGEDSSLSLDYIKKMFRNSGFQKPVMFFDSKDKAFDWAKEYGNQD